jgi:hypothetical protein
LTPGNRLTSILAPTVTHDPCRLTPAPVIIADLGPLPKKVDQARVRRIDALSQELTSHFFDWKKSVYARGAEAVMISAIGVPSGSGSSVPSSAQKVGAKSIIETVRPSRPTGMAGPTATNSPSGRWSPVRM